MRTSNQLAPNSFFLVLIGLYFSQGLPSGILAKALPPLMRDFGVSLSLISALKLLALPWFLKFLWAPFIDQRSSRRRWVFGIQCSVIPLLLVLALLPLESLMNQQLWIFLSLLLLINTLSATQDIATDGLAASSLHDNQLGLANTIQVAAYKMGLILGGSVLLILIDDIGWQLSLFLFSGLLAIALLPLAAQKSIGSQPATSAYFSTQSTTKVAALRSIKGFFQQNSFGWWLCILLTCKLSDALGSSMLNPMLIDKNFSLTEIGYLNSVVSAIGLAGAGIGGILFIRWHSKTLLLSVSFLQSLAILLFTLIASNGHISLLSIYAIAGFEQLVDGISTVIIFAFMMKQCRQNFEGTDYTLQNSVHIIGMGIASIASGVIAEHLGYNTLFISAFMLGIASLYFIWRWPMANRPVNT